MTKNFESIKSFVERHKDCKHEWVDNLPVRNDSQDGTAGQHCTICYKQRGYSV